MCGIVGVVNLDGSPVSRELVEAMNARLLHRGPDEDGLWFGDNVGLGMRRLSIIDLSGGRQPFFNETGDVATIYNGEIYNFPQVRHALMARGHVLRSHCDTEVIPHLYEEHGIDLPNLLTGMFAIAVWDRQRRALFLARDRLGVKPLYYAQLGQRFYFASELKAFEPCGILGSLSADAILAYTTYGYVPGPLTIYEGIYKLRPGHRLELVDGRAAVTRYWHMEYRPKAEASEPDLIEELDHLLRSAVRSELISDVPLGAFLSGGVDSSTVVAMMAAVSNAPVHTFSIGFDEASHDESRFAEAVARHFGTRHTTLTVRPGVWSQVDEIIRQFDEPFADASAIPTYCLSKLTRNYVTVALSGDGGDELFAGYDRYRDYFRKRVLYRIPGPLRRGAAGTLSNILPWGFRGKRFLRSLTLHPFDDYVWGDGELWHGDLLQPEFLASLPDADPAGPARRVFSADLPSELDALCLHDIDLYLPDDILTKVDRMSMAVSLEVRVPLLDHRVAEFAGTLPPSMRLRGRTGKYLLKKLLERYLPPEMVHRPKQGFGVPLGRWFRQELREELLDTLTPDRVRCVGVFRPSAVEFLVRQHLSRQRDQSTLLWRLFVFHLWDRLRLPRSNPATGHAAAPVAAAAS
jgi:asparagine synthase (glutamine-hydrolysing)